MTTSFNGHNAQGEALPKNKPSRNSPTKTEVIRFKDLTDQRTVVIHTGYKANRDAEARKLWQIAHNETIAADDAIAPELEPEQTLFVSPFQLDEGGRLYQMADKDCTKKIIVHQQGNLAFDKQCRLYLELKKQAPSAEILKGKLGCEADRWGIADCIETDDAAEQQDRNTVFPLVSGFTGFDAQASYLIKGLLPANSTSAIYGPSGSFKSFLAVSWACHVATGQQWDSRRVVQGSVLYIVGEGGVGVPRRVRAWSDQFNQSRDVPNLYRIDMPVFMAVDAQVDELKLAAQQVERETGLPVRLIVIDTLSRCFGAADENKAADMGAFIAGCDLVKAATGACVLVVHHTGKQEENGARGSSVFRAALDAEYLVKRESAESISVLLSNTKMKDDEPPQTQAYDLTTRITHYDDEGEAVTSLVVIDSGRAPVEQIPEELSGTANLTGNHTVLYQTIRMRAANGEHCTKTVIRDDLKAQGIDTKNWHRWLDKLERNGQITINGEEVILHSLRDKAA